MSAPEGRRYLNPDAIKAKQDKAGSIVVKCFNNGLYDTCPDPLNKAISEELFRRYEQGYFIRYDEIKISKDTYNDINNWNM